jgi:hypothetical protein
VEQVMSRLIAVRHQRIYYERFSLMLENEAGLEESAVQETLSDCSPVLAVRVVYCPAPSLTWPLV